MNDSMLKEKGSVAAEAFHVESSQNVKFRISNMDLHYGTFHALKNINMEVPEQMVTAFIGPQVAENQRFLSH